MYRQGECPNRQNQDHIHKALPLAFSYIYLFFFTTSYKRYTCYNRNKNASNTDNGMAVLNISYLCLTGKTLAHFNSLIIQIEHIKFFSQHP